MALPRCILSDQDSKHLPLLQFSIQLYILRIMALSELVYPEDEIAVCLFASAIRGVVKWIVQACFIICDEETQGIPILRISNMLAAATSGVAAEQQSVTTVVL